jgi:serine-protein kinase ATM
MNVLDSSRETYAFVCCMRLCFAQIAGFEKSFSIAATGISRPKIVTCIGSLGTRCVQLVKGHDEIRQDAVMEQVFCYVNELLRRRRGWSGRSSFSRNRDFRVVTYNIVPLSPAAGVRMR